LFTIEKRNGYKHATLHILVSQLYFHIRNKYSYSTPLRERAQSFAVFWKKKQQQQKKKMYIKKVMLLPKNSWFFRMKQTQ